MSCAALRTSANRFMYALKAINENNKYIKHGQIRLFCNINDKNEYDFSNTPSHLIPNILKDKINDGTSVKSDSNLNEKSKIIDANELTPGTNFVLNEEELQPYWKAMESRVIKRKLKPLRDSLTDDERRMKYGRGVRNSTVWDACDPYTEMNSNAK